MLPVADNAAPRPREHYEGTTRGLEGVLAQSFTILSFANDRKADLEEELFGAVIALFPNCSDSIEATTACLFGESLHGKAADSFALSIAGDTHSPDTTAKFFLRCIGVKVAADEPNDPFAVEDDAR